jgi:hypothetical protein
MRSEPLGLDRHYRRYWWLHSECLLCSRQRPPSSPLTLLDTLRLAGGRLSRLAC